MKKVQSKGRNKGKVPRNSLLKVAKNLLRNNRNLKVAKNLLMNNSLLMEAKNLLRNKLRKKYNRSLISVPIQISKKIGKF